MVMLHIVLCAGPLARLDRRFLPLLYNRRHMGVATFFLGLVHGLLALGFYHGFGSIAPPVSLLASNVQYGSLAAFPFEILGVIALLILFLMAATSHDFWLRNLAPPVWKSLHMLVYAAYGLVLLHVALGALRAERSDIYPVMLAIGVFAVGSLHLVSGLRERRRDRAGSEPRSSWINACDVNDIPINRGRAISVAGRERIALFRHANGFSAVSNVCAHQNGPLGEGRIIDGCITCPWHGYQYQPEDGCAPPPFTEKLATFVVKVENGRVWVNTEPLSPGTAVQPARVLAEAALPPREVTCA
jgi:nitrite reductase/ring-hydroxylating ferredoxin subunit/DMSO/TMAO reductase YedYZ heme-binding membrane subunit